MTSSPKPTPDTPPAPGRGGTGRDSASMPGSFSAFVVSRAGDSIDAGVRRLTPEDLPPAEVTVKVDWSVVNYKDGMVTRPGNRVARIDPLVPGVDLVGTVLASDAPSIGVGEQVVVHGYDLGVAHHGGFSELARAPGAWVVPLPDALTARRAAIMAEIGVFPQLNLRLHFAKLVDHGGLVGDSDLAD